VIGGDRELPFRPKRELEETVVVVAAATIEEGVVIGD
jgi:hypothetical protein